MKAKEFVDILVENELFFLTGVPCSYLKIFLIYLNSQPTLLQHIIATGEGEALSIATGYHLATNKVPIIYCQNSGLGNAINPITSLMDKEVYSIPAILFLTWRGEPGTTDEPQHKKMGRVMIKLLDDLEIPYQFASSNIKEMAEIIAKLKILAVQNQKPVALIFRPNLIKRENVVYDSPAPKISLMTREKTLEILLPKIGEYPIITTTGKTSREVFELREKYNQSHKYDFLTVGSMGCASGIALGIALQRKNKVFVIDGDGAVLMKMGTLGTVGYYQPVNFVHIIIDNGVYESTGSQPTSSSTLNWKLLLKSVGYKNIAIIKTKKQLEKLQFKNNQKCPRAIVVYSQPGSRFDLGRPSITPIGNKQEFMKFLFEQQ